ncbi:MAG: hypothetical protein IT254_01855 [Chitinophagaceae bacterium]|nr:hypothetical protein [Bacteroidota bacterium]MCC6257046.1 hypothetical protein [Chitinophagaceae bacterium]MCW5917893.1 hypothetical protein [Ferruginibacter sp.]
MENLYNAYSKEIAGQNYFFVKKYLTFPEFNNVPDVLVGYGMHADFDKACKIAQVSDPLIKERLKGMQETPITEAKVFSLPTRLQSERRQAR